MNKPLITKKNEHLRIQWCKNQRRRSTEMWAKSDLVRWLIRHRNLDKPVWPHVKRLCYAVGGVLVCTTIIVDLAGVSEQALVRHGWALGGGRSQHVVTNPGGGHVHTGNSGGSSGNHLISANDKASSSCHEQFYEHNLICQPPWHFPSAPFESAQILYEYLAWKSTPLQVEVPL